MAPNKLYGNHGGAPKILQMVADKSERRLRNFKVWDLGLSSAALQLVDSKV